MFGQATDTAVTWSCAFGAWVLPCSRNGRRSSLQSLYLHMGGTVIRTAFAYLSAVHLLQLLSNKHDVQKPCVVHRHVDFDCFFIHCRIRSHFHSNLRVLQRALRHVWRGEFLVGDVGFIRHNGRTKAWVDPPRFLRPLCVLQPPEYKNLITRSKCRVRMCLVLRCLRAGHARSLKREKVGFIENTAMRHRWGG